MAQPRNFKPDGDGGDAAAQNGIAFHGTQMDGGS